MVMIQCPVRFKYTNGLELADDDLHWAVDGIGGMVRKRSTKRCTHFPRKITSRQSAMGSACMIRAATSSTDPVPEISTRILLRRKKSSNWAVVCSKIIKRSRIASGVSSVRNSICVLNLRRSIMHLVSIVSAIQQSTLDFVFARIFSKTTACQIIRGNPARMEPPCMSVRLSRVATKSTTISSLSNWPDSISDLAMRPRADCFRISSRNKLPVERLAGGGFLRAMIPAFLCQLREVRAIRCFGASRLCFWPKPVAFFGPFIVCSRDAKMDPQHETACRSRKKADLCAAHSTCRRW
jgi:hypothetical protein